MSLMDAILDRPMDVVIAQLPLTAECKEALRGADNSLGKLLRLAICCEHGAWEEYRPCRERGLCEDLIWDHYREAALEQDSAGKQRAANIEPSRTAFTGRYWPGSRFALGSLPGSAAGFS